MRVVRLILNDIILKREYLFNSFATTGASVYLMARLLGCVFLGRGLLDFTAFSTCRSAFMRVLNVLLHFLNFGWTRADRPSLYHKLLLGV